MKLVKRLCKQLKESFKSGQVAINKAISLSQTTIPLLLGAVRAIGRFGSTGKEIDLLLFLDADICRTKTYVSSEIQILGWPQNSSLLSRLPFPNPSSRIDSQPFRTTQDSPTSGNTNPFHLITRWFLPFFSDAYMSWAAKLSWISLIKMAWEWGQNSVWVFVRRSWNKNHGYNVHLNIAGPLAVKLVFAWVPCSKTKSAQQMKKEGGFWVHQKFWTSISLGVRVNCLWPQWYWTKRPHLWCQNSRQCPSS